MATRIYRKGRPLVRTSIAIPRSMQKDMVYYQGQVNWSEICRKAIQRKINALDRERR